VPIIELGGPKNFSHLKKWASELPTLRTSVLKDYKKAKWQPCLPSNFPFFVANERDFYHFEILFSPFILLGRRRGSDEPI